MVSGKLLLQNKIVLFCILILVIIFVAKANIDIPLNTSSKNHPLIKPDPSYLVEGDLIFRKGRDLVSQLVLSQGVSTQFSHVGIVIKHEGIISVIHSLPENVTVSSGVQVEPFSSFTSIENASDIAIYRLIKENPKVIKKVKEYALQQIGKPFDTNFLLSTDNSMYCTELIVKAYSTAGVELVTNTSLIKVMLIDELVIPPDYLRRSHKLQLI